MIISIWIIYFMRMNLLVSSQMKPELLHGAVYNATGCTENTTTKQPVYNDCPLIILLNSRIFVVAVGSLVYVYTTLVNVVVVRLMMCQ